MDVHDIELQMSLFVVRTVGNKFLNPSLLELTNQTADVSVRELSLRISILNDNARDANLLLRISPYSPLARALVLRSHWQEFQQWLPFWETGGTQHSQLALALGDGYGERKKIDQAKQWYQSAIALAPSELAAYRSLANIYARQRDLDKWQATLEQFLAQPDLGLDHAKVNNTLAWFYIRQRQWDKAVSYGDKAAESWAEWALRTGALCHEGLGQWKKAEELYQRIEVRYQRYGDWLGFCIGTGEGDLELARATAEGYLSQAQQRQIRLPSFVILILNLYLDRPDQALVICEQIFSAGGTPLLGLQAALLADQLGQTDKRDAYLQLVQRLGAPNYSRLAALIRQDLAQGGKARFNADRLEQICLAGSDPLTAFHCAYFIGEYLILRDKTKAAIPFLARAAEPTTTSYTRFLAGRRLREHGIKHESFSQHVRKKNDSHWLPKINTQHFGDSCPP